MNLHEAARSGDLRSLRDRIETGDPIDGPDADGMTPMMVAAESGRLDALRALISAGASLDASAIPIEPDGNPALIARAVARSGLFGLIFPLVEAGWTVKARRKTQDGPTALMIAAANGHAEIITALIDSGANVDRRDRDGFSALGYAAALGQSAAVEILLGAMAEVDPVSNNDMTPLTLAARFGHAGPIGPLIAAGASLSAAPGWGALGPLHAATSRGHVDVAWMLLEAGARPDAKLVNETALGLALGKGNSSVVDVLARGGADLDATDWRKLTPTMRAVSKGDLGSLRVLLAAGASPKVAVSPHGWGGQSDWSLPGGATALHLAACLGDPEVVAALLDAGADAGARDLLDFTPLLLATASGHDAVIRQLTEAAPPPEGDLAMIRSYALVAAVRRGDAGRVRDLLQAGASAQVLIPHTSPYHYLLRCEGTEDFDPSTASGEGSFGDADRPVLNLAAELGHDAIVVDLLAAGASFDEKWRRSQAGALFKAAVEGHLASVTALLAAGADVNSATHEGQTPLSAASYEGHVEIVRALLSAGAGADAVGQGKSTPLSGAASAGHAAVVCLLLDAGARVRPRDVKDAAAHSGESEVVRLLLEAARVQGVKPDPATLAAAIWSGSIPLARMLLDAGFDANSREANGEPALVTACFYSTKLADLLLDSGADPNARSRHGRSALETAIMLRRVDLVRRLLELGADVEVRMSGDHRGETALIYAAGYGIEQTPGPGTRVG